MMIKKSVVVGVSAGFGFALFLTGCSSSDEPSKRFFHNRNYDYVYSQEEKDLDLPAGISAPTQEAVFTIPRVEDRVTSPETALYEAPKPPATKVIEIQEEKEVIVDTVKIEMQTDGNGYPGIMVHSGFSQAWDLVGSAVSQSALKQVDLNRDFAIYEVSDEADKASKNIKLTYTTNGILVSVQKTDGELVSLAEATAMLQLLYPELQALTQ